MCWLEKIGWSLFSIMSGPGFTAVIVCSKEVRSGLVICLAQNGKGDKEEGKKGKDVGTYY